ncbi:hypothetical protein D3C73_999890 [compost metagenome]
MNEVKLKLIEPGEDGIHRLHIAGAGAQSAQLLARKVVLATGIQGGGEWHVPPMIAASLPEQLYAHTSEEIDFNALAGRTIGILGGGPPPSTMPTTPLPKGRAKPMYSSAARSCRM